MILVDANLLIYAYDKTNPNHERARVWLENAFSATEAVAVSWVNILAFLRITTNPRLFEKPFSIAEAAARVDEWLEQPNMVLLEPGEEHWVILRGLLSSADAIGPMVMDAHLAALAIEHGATLCTADKDFTRFEGLEPKYPLAEGTEAGEGENMKPKPPATPATGTG